MSRIIAVLATLLLAQVQHLSGAANLVVQRQSILLCPSSSSGRLLLNLFNSTTAVQTIPGGTTITYNLSVPITAVYGSPIGTSYSVSGNLLEVKFASAVDVAAQNGFQMQVAVSAAGLPDGTLITDKVSVQPSTSVTFVESSTEVAAISDQRSCQVAPANAVTADDLNAVCPSAEEIREFNSDLTITFDGDPTSGILVCHASSGSADLTRLQERTYQALRFMQRMSFDSPLPWTSRSLYSWLTSAIRGIRFNPNTNVSFCCDPVNVINVQNSNLAVLQSLRPDILASLIALFVHEARHNQGFTHTCGNNDQTLAELGAWSAQYYAEEWMVFKTGFFFVPKSGDATIYRSSIWRAATNLLDFGTFCQLEQSLFTIPSRLDFGAVPSATGSLAQGVTITNVTVGSHVPAITLSGPNSNDFMIAQNGCSGAFIPPACSMVIRFQPATSGPRYAQLNIADGTATATVIPLTGSAVATITPSGIGPVYSTFDTIQPGSWMSIYGANFTDTTATWNGDFPTSLGGVTVTVNSKPAYLWFVSPEQINLQTPNDSSSGYVNVVVHGPMGSATSVVTLSPVAPSLNLFDSTHVAGVILTPDGIGAYGSGAYDLLGPAGVFQFRTRPVKVGETLLLYGVGFGPTRPMVPAGQLYSGAAPATNTVSVKVGGVPATVLFAGVSGAGLYQLNIAVPNAPSGDQAVVATVNGVETPAGRVVTIQ